MVEIKENTMDNNKKNSSYNSSYKHGNLMLASTTLSICVLMVLMLITTAFKSSISSLMTARTVSGILSALFFISAIVLGFMANKKDKSFWEFSIYSLIMSIGFISLLGLPFFVPGTKFFLSLFTTRNASAGLLLVNIIYLVFTLTYHTVKSKSEK